MWSQVGLHIPLDFIFQTKLVEVMEFQLNNFKDQKMMLQKCCTQYVNKFGKLSSGHRTRKGSVFIPIPKKGNAKECSHYHTIALFSHASKVILKILQVRFQQHVNHGIPDVQDGFRKGRGTRYQIVNVFWISKKAREFQKSIYFSFIDYAKDFDYVDHNKLENYSWNGYTRPLYLPPKKSVFRSRSIS